MWNCPICEKQNPTPVCSCGFDASCDYEAYPTLAPLGKSDIQARSALKSVRTKAEAELLHCKACNAVAFTYNPGKKLFQCIWCGQTHQLEPEVDTTFEEVSSYKNPEARISAGSELSAVARERGSVRIKGKGIDKYLNPFTDGAFVGVSAGDGFVAALRENGKVQVEMIGGDPTLAKKVAGWTSIRQISAMGSHIIGLTRTGTAVSTYYDVSQWNHLVAVAAGSECVVGLKRDGTVVFVGDAKYNPTEIRTWTDIVSISAGAYHIVGLKRDGTVVGSGYNMFGQRNFGQWKNITAVSAGVFHTVGLRADGTVVSTGAHSGDFSDWKDIIAVSAGFNHTLGFRNDGHILATGNNTSNQCDVNGMKI